MTSSSRFFRLRFLEKKLSNARLFRADRGNFRYALADAVIELRLEDAVTPIGLEVGLEKKGRTDWMGLGREGQVVALADPIRWESAASLFDALNKVLNSADTTAPSEKGTTRPRPTATG